LFIVKWLHIKVFLVRVVIFKPDLPQSVKQSDWFKSRKGAFLFFHIDYQQVM